MTDIKAVDIPQMSDADREENKGRVQVLNSLMVDSDKICMMGSRIWSVTNAILARESHKSRLM